MTTMIVDEVLVVFEGSRRLRRRPAGSSGGTAADDVTLAPVWPEPGEAARLRLWIRLGWPTLVLLDPHARSLATPRPPTGRGAGTLPSGVVELPPDPRDPPGHRRMAVDDLSWMSRRDRLRGACFLAEARAAWPAVGRGVWPALVEDELIGSDQPLRFACTPTDIGYDQLRHLIGRLYAAKPATGTTGPVPALCPSPIRPVRQSAPLRRSA